MIKTHHSASPANLLQGPSFKSMYIFSVAARHLNFSRAADELCITPSAVSHQIKRLEQTLGCKLFDKDGKQLLLTEAAQDYSNTLSHSFTQMREATRVITTYNHSIIQLGVNSAFAVKRLTPALRPWQEQHPGLDLRLQMINCDDNLANMDLDMVLGGPIKSGFYHSEYICQESYHPVCSRALAQTLTDKPLAQVVLDNRLIDLDSINVWQYWLQDKNFAAASQRQMLHFSHTLLMVEAALAGQGIALLEIKLIKNELASGELVLLDKNGYIAPNSGYYISCHIRHKRQKAIENLKRWVITLLD
jgi:LysR family glycine cleavage system transcriptional activator